jgi:hypothetical protein
MTKFCLVRTHDPLHERPGTHCSARCMRPAMRSTRWIEKAYASSVLDTGTSAGCTRASPGCGKTGRPQPPVLEHSYPALQAVFPSTGHVDLTVSYCINRVQPSLIRVRGRTK